MSISRRSLLSAAAVAPALPTLVSAASGPAPAATAGLPALPAKSDFARMPFTYLDSGSTHPTPLAPQATMGEYLRYKARDADALAFDMDEREKTVMAEFAKLVGCDPDELCFIQSTTMGEALVIQALDLPRAGGRIVTDALHFFGSFYTYAELGRAGMEVVTLPMTKEGRIDMNEMEAAIKTGTRLVSISAVSTTNGFQHDLKKVCDLAHAHGAHVYADIVHGAGTVPIDLHAAGVDFAASSSYKWLMGDFGLGFLYVRKGLLDKIRRPWWGYHQLDKFVPHVFPYDQPGQGVLDYGASADATGHFGMGTTSWSGVILLGHSLPWLNKVGIAAIQAWRQPMIDAVQGELRRRGYEPLTPLDQRTPLVAFALKDARAKLGETMKEAKIRMTISQNRFRVSVSVFNDMNDIDRLLSALPKAPPAG